MSSAVAPSLSVDLQAWPGIVLSVVGGRVAASNGWLERLTGAPVVGRALSDLLDSESSLRKWERIVAGSAADAPRAWELIFRSASSLLEPRTFSAIVGGGDAGDGIRLVEHPMDKRLDAMGGQMQALNSELSTTQRALVKEQARLAAALKDLERSNAALDDFAHVASHDLKAPLRAIIDYAELLETEVGPQLADEPRKYLSRISVLTARMRGMIDAVLEYARAGRASSTVELLDSGLVLSDIVDFLAPPGDVIIELPDNAPVVAMERVPFEQVFRNLISNAIKYRRDTGARIRVTAGDAGEYWRFAVVDNGPGIPAAQQQRIWSLFHTTRPQDSTGIGLALVKRIVDSQGGQVFVESAPGDGARFTVLWPKHPRSGERTDR
jgi:signal transduction histidine kinase